MSEFSTIEMKIGEGTMDAINTLMRDRLYETLDPISFEMFLENDINTLDELSAAVGNAMINGVVYSILRDNLPPRGSEHESNSVSGDVSML